MHPLIKRPICGFAAWELTRIGDSIPNYVAEQAKTNTCIQNVCPI